METEQTPTSQQLLPPPPVIRFGSYDTTIDQKRRLVLAAEIRNGMDPWRDGTSFFAFIGKNRKIWFFPKFPYLRMVSKAQVGLTPSDEDLAFYQVMVGSAFEVEWDKQGRVILPEKLLKRAKLTDLPAAVTLVGTVEHFQLWRTEEWEAHSDQLHDNLEPIVKRARENGLTL